MTVSLFTNLHRARLHRAFVGEQTLSRFGADAKHAALAPQRFVFGVEQCVLEVGGSGAG